MADNQKDQDVNLKKQVKWHELQVLLHVMSNSCYFLHYPEMHYSEMGNSFAVTLRQHSSCFVYIFVKLEVKNIPVAVWAVWGNSFRPLSSYRLTQFSADIWHWRSVRCYSVFWLKESLVLDCLKRMYSYEMGEDPPVLSSLVWKSFSRPSRWKSLGSSWFLTYDVQILVPPCCRQKKKYVNCVLVMDCTIHAPHNHNCLWHDTFCVCINLVRNT